MPDLKTTDPLKNLLEFPLLAAIYGWCGVSSFAPPLR